MPGPRRDRPPYKMDTPGMIERLQESGDYAVEKSIQRHYTTAKSIVVQDLPGEVFYQSHARKVIMIEAAAYPFAAAWELLLEYTVPLGQAAAINYVFGGSNREILTAELIEFQIEINGTVRAEYGVNAQILATNGGFNLVLSPGDILRVFYQETIPGYTFPDDFCFMSLMGWTYPQTVGGEG